MSSEKSRTLRSPLANARGLGTAHDGPRTWWKERMTALALVPLCLWFLSSMLCGMVTLNAEGIADWLAHPFPAMLMSLFLVMTFWHSKMGVQAVFEDYVHCEAAKIACVILNGLVFNLAALASLFAVFKLHFLH